MIPSTDEYAAEIRAVLDEHRKTRGVTAYVLLTLTGEQGAMSAAVGVYSSDEPTIMGKPSVSLVIHAATAPSFHEAAKLAEGWIEKSLPALVVRALSEGATFSDALTKMVAAASVGLRDVRGFTMQSWATETYGEET